MKIFQIWAKEEKKRKTWNKRNFLKIWNLPTKIGSEPLLGQNRANDKRQWRAEHAFTAPDTRLLLVAVSTWAAVTRSGRRPSVPRYPDPVPSQCRYCSEMLQLHGSLAPRNTAQHWPLALIATRGLIIRLI